MQDLNDLQSFAAVVRHGGFTAAERATGEAKAKLSKRVARLEKQFGVRLIERSTRSFRVTEVGRELYRQCEVIAQGLEAAEAIAARAHGAVCGVVRASCPPGLSQYVGGAALADFLARHPEVRVQLQFTSRPVDLINENIDVAFRVRAELEGDRSLTMRSLGRSRRILVVGPSLAADPPRRLEDLAHMPALSMNDQLDSDVWRLTSSSGERRTIQLSPRLGCADLPTLREAVLAGLGVALIPEESCAAELAGGALVQVLPEWHAPEGVVHLVFTTPKGLAPAVRAFIDHYVEVFAQLRRRLNQAR